MNFKRTVDLDDFITNIHQRFIFIDTTYNYINIFFNSCLLNIQFVEGNIQFNFCWYFLETTKNIENPAIRFKDLLKNTILKNPFLSGKTGGSISVLIIKFLTKYLCWEIKKKNKPSLTMQNKDKYFLYLRYWALFWKISVL